MADLFAALVDPVPAPLVRQYFAPSVVARAQDLETAAGGWARALVWAQVQDMLAPYLFDAQ